MKGCEIIDRSQKGLKFCLVVGGREVLDGLGFCGVRFYTLRGEHCTTEADLWLHFLHRLLFHSILCGGLHKLNKVPVVLL